MGKEMRAVAGRITIVLLKRVTMRSNEDGSIVHVFEVGDEVKARRVSGGWQILEGRARDGYIYSSKGEAKEVS